MSGKALRDYNTVTGSEWKNGSSSKVSLNKSYAGNADENLEAWQKKNGGTVVSTPANGSADENLEDRQKKNGGSVVSTPTNDNADENLEERQQKNDGNVVSTPTNGTEVVNSVVEVTEVEYIDSENLNDIEDIATSLEALLAGLDSKDWVMMCKALNDVRRLAIFHKDIMLNLLADVIPLVVKSLKNPRSAVCKTAIMTSSDIFLAYNDHIIDYLDPLLVQLLLKSSQDKRFVCEAAEKALVALTSSVSPTLLLPKLQPYLKHKNPRIRAKASTCLCRSVPRLGVEGIQAYGIDKLIQIAASQLIDKLPASREAARTLLMELQTVYDKSHNLTSNADPETQEIESWENFCHSKLSPLSAQAVLRVTSVAQEGLVLGTSAPQ